MDGSEAKSTTATSEKEIKDSQRNEGAAIHRDITNCHPELAAKSVETKSKRDFIPLPGVSLAYSSACSDNIYYVKTTLKRA